MIPDPFRMDQGSPMDHSLARRWGRHDASLSPFPSLSRPSASASAAAKHGGQKIIDKPCFFDALGAGKRKDCEGHVAAEDDIQKKAEPRSNATSARDIRKDARSRKTIAPEERPPPPPPKATIVGGRKRLHLFGRRREPTQRCATNQQHTRPPALRQQKC